MSAARQRATPRKATQTTVAIDLVAIAPYDNELTLLLTRQSKDSRSSEYALPWDGLGDESSKVAVERIAHDSGITAPSLLVQVETLWGKEPHPGKARVSIGYLLLAKEPTAAHDDSEWFRLTDRPALPARQASVVTSAVAKLRELAVSYSLALSLLDESFTLAAVQSMYELLLGRPVHKASFRRTLHGSGLVEPAGTWLADRRGRPAQLYRRRDSTTGPTE